MPCRRRDYEDGEDVATLSRPSQSLFGDKTPAVWQCSTTSALDSIEFVSDLRSIEHALCNVHVVPCIGGSLVLTLLHVLLLALHRRKLANVEHTKASRLCTVFLVQDRTE